MTNGMLTGDISDALLTMIDSMLDDVHDGNDSWSYFVLTGYRDMIGRDDSLAQWNRYANAVDYKYMGELLAVYETSWVDMMEDEPNHPSVSTMREWIVDGIGVL